MYLLIYLPFLVLFISCCVFDLRSGYFFLVWWMSFRISCKESLLSMNYLSLCFWDCFLFILPLFLKNSFAGGRILCYRFFSLSAVNVSSPAFWPPLFLMSCFSLCAFKIFSLVFQQFHYESSRYGSLCVYLILESLIWNL